MRRFALYLGAVCLCLVAAAVFSDAQANGGHKVCICHNPPGNPAAAHTICVGAPAVPAHLRHGDSLGECDVACDGKAGDTCEEDEFCKHRVGACETTSPGVCEEIPDKCPAHFGSFGRVCGCDGVTYDNACLAFAAGVNIEHLGACETPQACGGPEGATCPMGQFCKRAEGACGATDTGVCTDLPAACSAVQDLVCGCDGTTYSNACFAEAAGVGVLHAGACEPGAPCGGAACTTCEEGSFCNPPVGQCATGAEGTCAMVPSICPANVAPVCGCDGITYSNACLAAAARVGVSHTGACEGGGEEDVCGGTSGVTCGTGEFCKRPEGECAETAEGVCTTTPTTCQSNLEPVCGCDGATYANACVADGAGVTVASQGACPVPQSCGGDCMAACPTGSFCERPVGQCATTAQGICTEQPVECPVTTAEVCGCDGITYRNACFASAAGVSVSAAGPCAPAVEKKKKKK